MRAGLSQTRARLYRILNQEDFNAVSRIVHVCIMTLIIVSVVAIVLESEPGIYNRHKTLFIAIELFVVAVFIVEYLLRVWTVVDSPRQRYRHPLWGRLRYMVTPMALIDLLAILPVLIGFFVYNDLMILRGLRLVRVLKLTHHSHSMDLLLAVLKQERNTILSALFILCVLIILAATGIHMVEREVQPEAYGTIPRAIWWATVTLTTVGYGDVVPVTAAGKVFGTVIVISGIGMAALPAGIFAFGFTEEMNRRRHILRIVTLKYLKDGQIDNKERARLDRLGIRLGLSSGETGGIVQEILNEARINTDGLCPHCHKPLNISAQLPDELTDGY